jgi:peptidyl-prolyl cis-trans isomerase SurA
MVIRTALVLVFSAIVAVSTAQSPKSKTAKPKPLFSVKGQSVTTDEFIYLYKKNHQAPEDYTPAKIEEYLDLFINFKLKVEEAKTRGMDTTAAFKKEFAQYKEEVRKPYLPDSKLTDNLVKLTYNRLKEEVKASHILIALKPEATPDDTLKAYNRITELRNRVAKGEDFGALAAANSEDPSARSNNGSLGYFTAMQMVYPFETAAYTTPVGEVSKPIRTRFGYHILKVEDRRPARGEVEVAHIMIRTGDGKDNDKARNTIFEIYDQLQAGVKWDELCKQYSEDPGSKDNGGKLRPFGVGVMANVPEFERAAFNLQNPGDISDPVQTQYGWHILRLERKIPLPSFEEGQASLKGRVNRDERTQISKQAFQLKLRRDYHFAEVAAVKAKVLALADTTLQKGKWKAPAYANAAKEVLFTLNATKKYDVDAFLRYAEKNQKGSNLEPAKYLEQLYNNYVDASIIQLVEEDLVNRNPEYTFLLREYYEGILLFEIMEKEVWNRASADSAGQRRYYEAHRANYNAGERARATFYSAATSDFVNPLKDLVQRGDELKIQEFVALNKVKTETGFYKKEDKAVLQKVNWAKGAYPAENNGMYYLAWIKDILPPGPMSFEEARSAIISDYQTYLEKDWVAQLKKKYPVKVNEKNKRVVLQQLQK